MNLLEQLRPDLVDRLLTGRKTKTGSLVDFETSYKALKTKHFVTELTVHELLSLNRATDYAFMSNKTCVNIFDNFYNEKKA